MRYPKADIHITDKTQVLLDFSNYATQKIIRTC